MKENEQVSIEELIDSETEKRLEEMGRDDYEFPPRITRGDVIAMALCLAGSLILVALCMLGVIK